MKRSNKLVDLYITIMNKKGKYVEVPDVVSFTSPDVAFADGELTGAGILGTINIPDIFNIDAMEATLTVGSWAPDVRNAINPDGVSIRMNYAIDTITNGGTSAYDSYSEIIKGRPKNIPGGDRKKGEKIENAISIAVRYYKLAMNGEVIHEIAPLNGTLIINKVDYGKRLKKALKK